MSCIPQKNADQHDLKRLNKFYTLGELLQGNDREFVSAAYQALLGRKADDDGLATYTSLLLDGKSRVEVLIALRCSKEGKTYAADVAGLDAATSFVELLAHSDNTFICCTFQTLLLRPIDTNACLSYGQQLRNSVPRLLLLSDIRNSVECKSKDAVALEMEGIAKLDQSAFTSKFRSSAAISSDSTDESVPAPPVSPVKLMNWGDRHFIHGLYQILLAREADAVELKKHETRLKSGASRLDIIRTVIESDERHLRRTMLHQLGSAISDLQLLRQPILGRAARLRSEQLDRDVEKKRVQMLEYQLLVMKQQFKHQLEAVSKQSVNVDENGAEKKRVLKLNQLSPLARDIYFQIKTGLEEHEEHGV
jgi:hypothetical protein